MSSNDRRLGSGLTERWRPLDKLDAIDDQVLGSHRSFAIRLFLFAAPIDDRSSCVVKEIEYV